MIHATCTKLPKVDILWVTDATYRATLLVKSWYWLGLMSADFDGDFRRYLIEVVEGSSCLRDEAIFLVPRCEFGGPRSSVGWNKFGLPKELNMGRVATGHKRGWYLSKFSSRHDGFKVHKYRGNGDRLGVVLLGCNSATQDMSLS